MNQEGLPQRPSNDVPQRPSNDVPQRPSNDVPQGIIMNEIPSQPTIEPADTDLRDMTGLFSPGCYTFGQCMKVFCRIDKTIWRKPGQSTASLNDEGCTCTTQTTAQMTGAVSATSGLGMAAFGATIAVCDAFCCPGCATTSTGFCGTYNVWQSFLLCSAGFFGVTVLSLGCCCGIHICNRYGGKCTKKLGCHSFSRGFEH
ncbi:MAG: hypothetical protein Barrevirus11_14 [Barrevirus sp.]|uniref:Uncharacterized protein n=1 Tax=Barrevirus sp. TaxID=2487763 RepID=A0A3G4ZRY5_9VIRU|nr:MAG: hypothetical protein Barrevirus11_14 [Barrevirus sp.]